MGTAVTDGIESALAHARAVAGGRYVGLCGADVFQQYLAAGLVDEIHLHVVPVLLGSGVRLFAEPAAQVTLECTGVLESDGVTHMRYRIPS